MPPCLARSLLFAILFGLGLFASDTGLSAWFSQLSGLFGPAETRSAVHETTQGTIPAIPQVRA